MKVAVAQFEITPGDVEKNFNKGLEFIAGAIKKHCRLILLPEVWTTGFLFKKLKELSKQTPEILEKLKKISNDICICGSYVVDDKPSNKVFNIFYAIDKGKIIFEYKKTMLFTTTGEDKFFNPGNINQSNTFLLDDITVGVSVCYELRFPEFFRKSAFGGALIHLHPAIWPVNRLNHWLTLTTARAIENQYFLLTANGTKKSGNWELAGHSSIINPWGESIKCACTSEDLIVSELNLGEIDRVRNTITSLKDSLKVFK